MTMFFFPLLSSLVVSEDSRLTLENVFTTRANIYSASDLNYTLTFVHAVHEIGGGLIVSR